MKIRINMKTPDCVDRAIARLMMKDPHSEELAIRAVEVSELSGEFFRFGESCIVELDTETGTATVLKIREW